MHSHPVTLPGAIAIIFYTLNESVRQHMPNKLSNLVMTFIVGVVVALSGCDREPHWHGLVMKILPTQPTVCTDKAELVPKKNESGNYGVIHSGEFKMEMLGEVICVGKEQLVSARGQMFFQAKSSDASRLISGGLLKASDDKSIDVDIDGAVLHLALSAKSVVCVYGDSTPAEQFKIDSMVTVVSSGARNDVLSIKPGPLLLANAMSFNGQTRITGYDCQE